jgi:hypothetical protein
LFGNFDFSWHDGNLVGLSVDWVSSPLVKIKCALYRDLNAVQRMEWEFSFAEPTKLKVSADFLEMRDHRLAGEISDGEILVDEGITQLRLYLTGGVIEVSGPNLVITCLDSKAAPEL